MLLNGLYTVVDAYFVARYVGGPAFAAISAVFPLQILLVSLAVLVSNGASVLISRHIGAKDPENARRIAGAAFALAAGMGAFIAGAVWLAGGEFLELIGLNSALRGDALRYLQITAAGSAALFGLSVIADVHRGMGNGKALFVVIVTGALANVLLDALLIVGCGMGVAGAALASLLGQGLALLVGFRLLRQQPLFRSGFSLGLTGRRARQIILLGLPVAVMYLGGALVMLLCNLQITHLAAERSEILLAAYGMLARVNIFISLPLIAMTSACQTMTGLHAGAGHAGLTRKSILIGLAGSSLYLIAMTGVILSHIGSVAAWLS